MKKREEFFICIGINADGALIMLNTIFDHGSMCGATGSEFYPVSQEDVDEKNDRDYVIDAYDIEHYWQEALESGSISDDTTLDEFADSWILNSDGEFFGHDTSYIQHIPESIRREHYPDAVTFECVGGGRMFPRDLENLKVVFRPDLVERIIEIEKQDDKKHA